MSEDGTSGGATALAPTESSGASASYGSPEVKGKVLQALSKSEDASDFIAESRSQEIEKRGEDLNATQRADRVGRVKKRWRR